MKENSKFQVAYSLLRYMYNTRAIYYSLCFNNNYVISGDDKGEVLTSSW